jgi:hypothetical protein
MRRSALPLTRQGSAFIHEWFQRPSAIHILKVKSNFLERCVYKEADEA